VSPPDQVNPPPEGGWESLKVDELKAELDARGLPKSGKKDELIARLADDDVAQAGTTSEAAPAEEGAPEAATSEAAQEAGVEAAAADADEAAAEELGAEHAEPAAEELGAEHAEPAAEELGAEDAEPAAEGDAEDGAVEAPAKQPRRRRGSAETGTRTRKTPARRPDEAVLVRARARYVRSAPRKARLVMDHIRGKRVEQAQAILQHAPRAVSGDILKLLNSAVANAESAYELGPDELTIRRAFVDEGPTIKRFRPRALGRATKINKRTSHMTIELTTEGNGR
jgi:large subunit ribosomal protein L22